MRRWAALGVCLTVAVGCRPAEKTDSGGDWSPGVGAAPEDGGAAPDAGAPGCTDAGPGVGEPTDAGPARDAAGVATDSGRSDGGADAGTPGDVTLEPPAELGTCAAPPALSSAMRLAPVDPTQRYVRCGTYGPEGGWQVTLSPGGRFLAAQTGAGTVRLIDVQTWREVVQVASPVGRLDAAAFSPDGLHLATLSAEAGEVTLWRTSDGGLERSWALGPVSGVNATRSAMAFSADGRTLATSLGLVDITGPAALQTPQVDPESNAFGTGFSSVELMANDNMLLVRSDYEVGDSNNSTRLVLEPVRGGGSPVTLFNVWTLFIHGIATSADGQLVAFASQASTAQGPPGAGLFVVRAATGELVFSDPTFVGTVLAFSPDSGTLYVQQRDIVSALDARTQRPLSSFAFSAGATFKTLAPDGQLVTTDAASTSWWDPATGSITRTLPYVVNQLVWSRDGGLEIATGGGALFHATRAADHSELCSAPGASAGIRYVTTSPAGSEVAYGYDDGTVEVAPAGSGTAAARLATNLSPITNVAVSESGTRVAISALPWPASAPSPAATVFDVATGAVRAQIVVPAAEVTASLLSPDGTELALGWVNEQPYAQETRVVNVDSGAVLLDLQPTDLGAYTSPNQFSFDGTELAVATDQGVQAWRLADATLVKSFGIGTRALSPYWTFLATINGGDTVVSWASTGTTAGTFLTEGFAAATFGASNGLFAAPVTVTHTHAVDYYAEHLWDLETGTQLRVLPASPDSGASGTFALPGDGAQILTLDDGAVDIWCR